MKQKTRRVQRDYTKRNTISTRTAIIIKNHNFEKNREQHGKNELINKNFCL